MLRPTGMEQVSYTLLGFKTGQTYPRSLLEMVCLGIADLGL